jgi:BirA family biotin operon repressor/biotin-[acetyl-CoA-carboxylase] ligase
MEFYPIHFDQIQSTNDYCINLLSKSNPIEGTVITTYKQLSGNGQIGRKWFSDEEKNITSSIILYPHFLPIEKLFYLNIVLSLSIRKSIETMLNEQIMIKWPNDIYYNNCKIAGLLIQQSIQGKKIVSSVLGYGINLNQDTFPHLLPNPVSIFNISGKLSDLNQFQKKILIEVGQYYTKLKEGKYLELKLEYLKYLYRRGEICSFKKGDEAFEAELLGIDSLGKLSLNKNGKVENYGLNQISFIIPA